jgi:3-hydroxybutyryl-CoA dehydratase
MKKIILNSEFEFKNTFSENDVLTFASLSQDDNPIHLDKEYAKNSIFGNRVIHGVLLLSMFSKIFGTIYPGRGGIYLSQTSKFIKPAFIGDEIRAKVTLIAFDNHKKRGIFLCETFNRQNHLLLTGEAKILFPKSFSLL